MIYQNHLKRVFDSILVTPFLFLLAPCLLILVPLVKLDAPGPFLFRQTRVGRGGKLFTIYKIRTMRHQPQQTGSYSTSKNDPRISRVGRILRKTSLDEIPQLWNILKGDMSLIGPRPDVPDQKCTYSEDEWRSRHLLRPGLTGLAQSTLRSTATHQQRLRLDLFYVKKASFPLDLLIICKTFQILLRKGTQT